MRFTKSSNDFWLKMPWIIAEQSHYQEMLILMSQSVDEGNIYLSLILLNENLYCFCLLTVNYFFDFVIVGEYQVTVALVGVSDIFITAGNQIIFIINNKLTKGRLGFLPQLSTTSYSFIRKFEISKLAIKMGAGSAEKGCRKFSVLKLGPGLQQM